MDSYEQSLLRQIEKGLESSDPGLAGKLSGRRLSSNSPEGVEFRHNLRISVLVSVVSIAVVLLIVAIALVVVHFYPIHTPVVPYGYNGG